MRHAVRIRVVTFLLVLTPLVAQHVHAQAPVRWRDFRFKSALAGRLQVEAGSLVTRDEGRRLLLRDGVVLRASELLVRAEWAEIFTDTERVVLAGSVQVIEEKTVLLCDRLELDAETSAAVIRRATILVKDRVTQAGLRKCKTASGLVRAGFNRMTLSGVHIEREGERYDVEEARFTACDCDGGSPSWEIRASHADIVPNERAWLIWPVLYLKGLPVFILPVAYLPLSERRTGFLFPQFNYSGRDGFVLSESFFIALGQSVDATMSVDWFEERGVRKRLEVRARPTGHSGIDVRIAHIDDRKLRDTETRAALRDRFSGELDAWAKGPSRTMLRASVRAYSDSDINRDFMSELAGRAADLAPSTLVFEKRGDDTLWMLDATFRQDLRYAGVDLFGSDAHDTIQRLPALSFSLAPVRFHESVPLVFALELEAANLSALSSSWQDWGMDGSRDGREPNYSDAPGDRSVDNVPGGEGDGVLSDGELRRAFRFRLEPELSAPFQFGRYLRFEASLRHRQLVYLPHGPSPQAGLETPDAGTRGITFAGLSVGTELSRTFGDADAPVGHVVAPWVRLVGAWRGLSSEGPRPYLDLYDRQLQDATQALVGVDNVLYRMAPGAGWERFLSLSMTQALDIREGRVGQVAAELGISYRPFSAGLLAAFDWSAGLLAELDASASVRDRRGDRVNVSYLYLPSVADEAGRPLPLSERVQREEGLLFGLAPAHWRALGETVHVVQGTASVEIAWGLGLTAGASLDLREGALSWYGGGLHYNSTCRCWGFSVTARMLRGQDFPDIFFLLDLAYLGATGVGTNRKF